MAYKTPIGELLEGLRAAPSNSQLDRALKKLAEGATTELSTETRRSLRSYVASSATKAARHREAGENGAARALAAEADRAVLDIVGSWSPPRDESLDGITDPRELARHVPRPGGGLA